MQMLDMYSNFFYGIAIYLLRNLSGITLWNCYILVMKLISCPQCPNRLNDLREVICHLSNVLANIMCRFITLYNFLFYFGSLLQCPKTMHNSLRIISYTINDVSSKWCYINFPISNCNFSNYNNLSNSVTLTIVSNFE